MSYDFFIQFQTMSKLPRPSTSRKSVASRQSTSRPSVSRPSVSRPSTSRPSVSRQSGKLFRCYACVAAMRSWKKYCFWTVTRWTNLLYYLGNCVYYWVILCSLPCAHADNYLAISYKLSRYQALSHYCFVYFCCIVHMHCMQITS